MWSSAVGSSVAVLVVVLVEEMEVLDVLGFESYWRIVVEKWRVRRVGDSRVLGEGVWVRMRR